MCHHSENQMVIARDGAPSHRHTKKLMRRAENAEDEILKNSALNFKLSAHVHFSAG